MFKRVLSAWLIIAMFVMSLALTPAARADGAVRIGSEPIAPGVVQETYHWATSYGNIRLQVLRCDLSHPDFNMKVVAGRGSYTQRATVSDMAARTDAVALINGDFFNTALQGAPIGPSIVDGALHSSPAVIVGLHSLGIDANGRAAIEPMIFNGSVTAADGASFPIDGLNKTYYWHDPSLQESHTDTIQLYDDFWPSASRGHHTNSEVLVNADGVVEDISYGSTFAFGVPTGKHILQVNGQAEAFVKEHVRIGSTLRITTGVLPDRGWTFLVGGHALITDQYQMVPYTKDINVLGGVRARTAAGVSEDGNTLWLVTAEGRTGRSVGITLASLGYFMQQLGVWRAVNLDGGGSTTMVAKALGSDTRTVQTYPEGYAAQRAVVNGIGIYNDTPVLNMSGIGITANDRMVIGESIPFDVTRAWDDNLHPHDPAETTFSWSEDAGLGAWGGNWFLALKPGQTTVTATGANGASGSKTLTVLGAEHIQSIAVVADRFRIHGNGDTVQATLRATLHDGRTLDLSPQVANWSVSGFVGEVDPYTGSTTITGTNDLANGHIVAGIGELRASALLGSDHYRLLDMTIGSRTYWLDGQSLQMERAPFVEAARTMVPLRFITETYGGAIEWDNDTRTIHMQYKNHQVILPVDENTALVDGVAHSLDVPAMLVDGRTMVPLRFISEALGMQVDYDAASRTVSISEKIV